MSWNQAICWSCWLNRDPGRVPVRAVDPDPDDPHAYPCAWCGTTTHDRVFVRADPATVRFPMGGEGLRAANLELLADLFDTDRVNNVPSYTLAAWLIDQGIAHPCPSCAAVADVEALTR